MFFSCCGSLPAIKTKIITIKIYKYINSISLRTHTKANLICEKLIICNIYKIDCLTDKAFQALGGVFESLFQLLELCLALQLNTGKTFQGRSFHRVIFWITVQN
jgi:hypothetical protein